MTETKTVEVTQADRDAAADYLDTCGWDWGACGDVRAGRVDHPVVRTLAAYRLASQSLSTDEGVSRSSTTAWPADAQFKLGGTVQKKGRASWRGTVVGWYRTDLTALGYAVESAFEPGSVQIYPESALLVWDAEALQSKDTPSHGG